MHLPSIIFFVNFAVAAAGATQPAADSATPWRYSREMIDTADPFVHFPLFRGNVWFYENTFVQAQPKTAPVRWTTKVRVHQKKEFQSGTLVELRIEYSRPEKMGYTNSPGSYLPKTIPLDSRFFYLFNGQRVYRLTSEFFATHKKRFSTIAFPDSALGVPAFYFPMSVGLRWADSATEQRSIASRPTFLKTSPGKPPYETDCWVVNMIGDVVTANDTFHNAHYLELNTRNLWKRVCFVDSIGIVKKQTVFRNSDTLYSELLSYIYIPSPDASSPPVAVAAEDNRESSSRRASHLQAQPPSQLENRNSQGAHSSKEPASTTGPIDENVALGKAEDYCRRQGLEWKDPSVSLYDTIYMVKSCGGDPMRQTILLFSKLSGTLLETQGLPKMRAGTSATEAGQPSADQQPTPNQSAAQAFDPDFYKWARQRGRTPVADTGVKKWSDPFSSKQ